MLDPIHLTGSEFTLSLNLTYFTTINKEILQLILMLFISSDISVKRQLMWEETRVPGENPRVRVGDHITLLHTTTMDPEKSHYDHIDERRMR